MPAALLVVATPFIGLLFYSSMNADDFAKATLSFNCAKQPSLLATTWMEYTKGSGRWLTSLLEILVSSKFDLIASYRCQWHMQLEVGVLRRSFPVCVARSDYGNQSNGSEGLTV